MFLKELLLKKLMGHREPLTIYRFCDISPFLCLFFSLLSPLMTSLLAFVANDAVLIVVAVLTVQVAVIMLISLCGLAVMVLFKRRLRYIIINRHYFVGSQIKGAR